MVNGTDGQRASDLQRVADVPIYFADPLVRRSPPLQKAADAVAPAARMNAATLAKQGFSVGDKLRVRLGEGEALLIAHLDAGLADGCVRIAAAHQTTADLGALFGQLTVERA